MQILGIDVGGSGIKGAIVDITTGKMLTERFRIPTPHPATPSAITHVIEEIVKHHKWEGPVGVGFPTSIKNGICLTESNLNKQWVGVNAETYFSEAIGLPFRVINDADAAALAEMRIGAGKNKSGLVIVVTLGTGIGSGVFFNGKLIPNCELGQMHFNDYQKIEHYAANSVRKHHDLPFNKWGKRVNKVLNYYHLIFSPDLFIMGGGGAKHLSKIEPQIKVPVPVIAAKTLNEAGIIGAAMAGEELVNGRS